MAVRRELLTRHPGNPILTWEDSPLPANAVYNAGAAKVGERYLLLLRLEDDRRDNHLHCAWSDNGVDFVIEAEPMRLEIPEDERRFEYHQYDPRITFIDGAHLIAYCAQGFDETVRIGLARTEDFRSFERLGFITPPWNRNCTIFPERIGGRFARIERPFTSTDAFNMISFSPDLIHWGGGKMIELRPQTWMRNKWGCGPTPFKTDRGWLMIFHGVWEAIDPIYRLGVALLDLEEPWRVIGQHPGFILTPTESFERIGEVNNCVFSNGAILEPDGEIKVYYGAADTVIALATGHIDELLEACLK